MSAMNPLAELRRIIEEACEEDPAYAALVIRVMGTAAPAPQGAKS